MVLGHDPWKRYTGSTPTTATPGWLTTDGVVAARDPKFFPDQPHPHHRPDRLLLFEADEPDHAEDVTDHVEDKLRALLAHESQFESTMKAGTDPELDPVPGQDRGQVGGCRPEPPGWPRAEVFKLIDDL